jgi:hypothetical protein
MPRPSHPSWFDHPKNIWWILFLSTKFFLHPPVISPPPIQIFSPCTACNARQVAITYILLQFIRHNT